LTKCGASSKKRVFTHGLTPRPARECGPRPAPRTHGDAEGDGGAKKGFLNRKSGKRRKDDGLPAAFGGRRG
jgi:hypothetical protein